MNPYTIQGDCIEVMYELIRHRLVVQSIVTDGPYGIGFLNKHWDNPNNITCHPEVWRLCYHLLPPGGHLLAFAGTRTYHRIVSAIDDAGFEIRDKIEWVYGQGFPKSRDVAKAIDYDGKGNSASYGDDNFYNNVRDSDGPPLLDLMRSPRKNPNVRILSDEHRERWQQGYTGNADIVPLVSAEAQEWQGWGTHLKPAHESIVLARKPKEGTVAANVLAHSTGAINIDGCRIECNDKTPFPGGITSDRGVMLSAMSQNPRPDDMHPEGRWPANFIHDGSEEVIELFPLSNGQQGDVSGNEPSHIGDNGIYGHYEKTGVAFLKRGDTGSAARFFYCAKVSQNDRNGSKHPTMKPLALMRYLVRLVTPPGGIVLDPFAGTGTTGEAAILEGFRYLLIEREPEFVKDIERRLGKYYNRSA